MLLTVIAILASTLAAARPGVEGRSAVSISANGRVTTQEGVTFQLPPGLAYSVHEEGGQRTYVAVREEDTTVVTVSEILSEAEFPCQAKVQHSVKVVPFETSRGLRACSIDASPEDSALAVSLIYVKSLGTFVVVTGVAPSDDASHRLAAGVANSVQVDAGRSRVAPRRVDIPRAEPRMVGCFDQSTGHSFSGGFVRGGVTRCFHEDFTVTQRSFLLSSMRHENHYGDIEGTASAIGDGAETRGRWNFRDGRLSVRYDDGSEAQWEITFGETSVLANDTLWERL